MRIVRRSFWLVLLGACGLGVLVTLALLAQRLLPPRSGSVAGLRVGGQAWAAGTPVEPAVQERARRLASDRVVLVLGDEEHSVTWSELGVRLDEATLSRQVESFGRTGCWATRLDALRRARAGHANIPLPLALDFERLSQRLAPLKEVTDEHEQPARLDFAANAVLPHRPGSYLDVHASAARLLAAALAGETRVELVRTEIDPVMNRERVRAASFDVVLAEYHTSFGRTGDGGDRATNIETGASRIDGVVLGPGEMISFNRVVGARTLKNGFRPGWEIYRGEMVKGVGGGTCQVSSTLHAAAFEAGLDVVERYPHSRPSAYIGLGLDSTVSWPSVDLKLRNPWAFPVAVRAEVEQTSIRVKILGQSRPARVEYTRQTLAVMPFKRKVTESSWLSPGKFVRKQKGIRGYRVLKTRRIFPEGGEAKVETSIDVYWPTAEHFIVPTDSDPAELLPPAPEGSQAMASAGAEAGS